MHPYYWTIGAQLLVHGTISGTDQDVLNHALNARTSIGIADIGFLSDFTPRISDAQGPLHGSMKISGSLKAPVFEGQVSTTDTRLTLDEAGITLEKIAMTLQGKPDGDIALNLAAQSGDGQLTIKAESNVHSKPRTARVQITGNDFQVMNTREAKISASPDLNLATSGNKLDIEGKVGIPHAHIKPKK